MRVAILHDYLNQFGGAERVLQALLELFPKADLYTLLYDDQKTLGLFKNNIRKTSILDKSFIKTHHRAFIPLMPLAAGMLTSPYKYDLVVSSTAGYGKGINIRARYHISYCHSPLRYAWEIDYLKDLPFAPWPIQEIMVRPIAYALRRWDKRSSARVNVFIANSRYIADKVSSYYGRHAEVVYPPVDSSLFYKEKNITPGNFFLMAGRLLYYKGFDLGIRACARLGVPLVIIGSGPEFKKLQSLARGHDVRFLGNVPDRELCGLYNEARALLFPQIEDFGLVAAEAQACGLPVLAYKQGGASEIVIPDRTGLLFEEQTSEALIEAIKNFNHKSFDRNAIARSATRFSKDNFKKKFENILSQSGFHTSFV